MMKNKSKKTDNLTIRLTPELRRDLENYADHIDRSIGWVLRDILEENLPKRLQKHQIKSESEK